VIGNSIAIEDVGKYVDSKDVGLHATQVLSAVIVGPIGILRWGLAMFGTTGILGFAPTLTANSRRLNVREIDT